MCIAYKCTVFKLVKYETTHKKKTKKVSEGRGCSSGLGALGFSKRGRVPNDDDDDES